MGRQAFGQKTGKGQAIYKRVSERSTEVSQVPTVLLKAKAKKQKLEQAKKSYTRSMHKSIERMQES